MGIRFLIEVFKLFWGKQGEILDILGAFGRFAFTKANFALEYFAMKILKIPV